MTLDDEFFLVRRMLKQGAKRWTAIGNDVFADRREIGTMKSPQMAELVAAMHNVFLPMMNNWMMAIRRLRDVETLEEQV